MAGFSSAQTRPSAYLSPAASETDLPRPPYPPDAGNPVAAELVDPDGNSAPASVSVVSVGDRLRIAFSESPRQMKPGKYTLKLWILRNQAIWYAEQDFLWGVLAVNFSKSVYTLGDEVKAGFGVLNDRGHTVCDASVEMLVMTPSGKRLILSTGTDTIKPSPACGPQTVTNEADYQASFPAKELGAYEVTVTAHTVNGPRTVTDSFRVEAEPRYDVVRTGPTRIYPWANYEMALTVTARQNFRGKLTETVPASFDVFFTPERADVRKHGDLYQTITWDADLKTGEARTFSYFFDAPDRSPDFYRLGPLKVGGSQNPDDPSGWREARLWQIASDAAGDIILFWDTANGAIPAGWSCISCSSTGTFFGVFPRASSTFGSASTSRDTVSHNASSALTAGGAGASKSDVAGTEVPQETHEHRVNSFVTGSGDIRPPFKTLQFIRANTTTLPNGIIGMFTANSSSLGASWTYYTSTENRYLVGGNTNATGGAAEHRHVLNATSTNASNTLVLTTGGGAVSIGSSSHSHYVTGTSAFASNTPSYVAMVFGQLNATRTLGIQTNGLVALFDDTSLPSADWAIISTSGSRFSDRLIIGSSTFGATSTNTTHNHATSTFASQGPSATALGKGPGGQQTPYSDGSHTHSFPITMEASTSMPVNRYVIMGQYTSPPNPPVVSAVAVTPSPIVLTVNTTTQVTVSFTVADDDGCGDVFQNGRTTTTLYRSGASTTCTASGGANPNSFNYLFCYVVSTSTSNCSGGSTANATATLRVWYFADATDASSSYSGESWRATVFARDAAGATSTSSTVSGVQLNSLLGIDVATSTDYGTVQAGSSTGATNTVTWVKNAGNTSTSLRLSGTALTSGSNVIPTSSQHWATTTFTYGTTEQVLSSTDVTATGFSIPRPPLTYWATTTEYPDAIGFHSFVVANNIVYGIGGCIIGLCTADTSTVRYAQIGSTGTLGAWATTTPYPNAIGEHGVVSRNNYVYAIAGTSDTTTTVRYAQIGSTGTLGAWATTTPYPDAIRRFPAVTFKGYVYVIGGNTGAAARTSTVRYAPIGSTGTLGQWATTTPYPDAIDYSSAAIWNDYIYVIGGDSGSATSTVRYAPIGSTGTLGAWATTTPFPFVDSRRPVIAADGFLYAIGGCRVSVCNLHTSTVRYAPIGSTGTLGAWATTTNFPIIINDQSVVAWNGYIYSIGGTNGVYQSSIYMASMASRNTYWGIEVPSTTASATYTGVNAFTAVFEP